MPFQQMPVEPLALQVPLGPETCQHLAPTLFVEAAAGTQLFQPIRQDFCQLGGI